jgi:cardiolipin synthase
VSVIIDWAGSVKMDAALLDLMHDAGVRVERYRPLRWYHLGRLNNRTHRKLLVVDGQIAFTGGVGIADHWRGNAENPDHWRETHFRIDGPVVAQFQAAFNDNWIKTTGEVLNGPAQFPPLATAGSQDAHLFISSPASGSDSMHLMYLMAIAAAERTIDVTASYFVPDALIDQALLAARGRGVRVRILVPGPHIDSDVVRLSSRSRWGPLLQAGVEIYEYQPTMLHSKVFIVDGEMVSVGSTNLDIRSFRLNDEASLNVYDRAFAERMTTVFDADLTKAVRYTYETWQRRPWTEKFIETIVQPIRSQL